MRLATPGNRQRNVADTTRAPLMFGARLACAALSSWRLVFRRRALLGSWCTDAGCLRGLQYC